LRAFGHAPGKRVEHKAEFVFYCRDDQCDFDPVALTQVLEIAPTSIERRGDAGPSGRVVRSTAWCWQLGDRTTTETYEVVQEVLDIFEPVADRIAEARARCGLDLILHLVIKMYGRLEVEPDGSTWASVPTPSTAFSSQMLGKLAELGCSLDIDQYVLVPAD